MFPTFDWFLPLALLMGMIRDWQRAGVWQHLHHRLLDELGRQGQLDWSRASVDSLSVRAKRGTLSGPNPTGRGKPGS